MEIDFKILKIKILKQNSPHKQAPLSGKKTGLMTP
jgi:hypothetical protein